MKVSRRSLQQWLVGTFVSSILPGCLLGTDPKTSDVTITTDKQTYRPNDPIHVTIHNGLRQIIYAVPEGSGSTFVHLEQQVDAQWQPREAGRVVQPTFRLAIAPQNIIQGVFSPAPPTQHTTTTPYLGKPTEPKTVHKDLQTLPPSKPWTPDDSIREIPQRRSTPPSQQPEVHAAPSRWNSGTYRFVIRFTIGALDGQSRHINSEHFVVTP